MVRKAIEPLRTAAHTACSYCSADPVKPCRVFAIAIVNIKIMKQLFFIALKYEDIPVRIFFNTAAAASPLANCVGTSL